MKTMYSIVYLVYYHTKTIYIYTYQQTLAPRPKRTFDTCCSHMLVSLFLEIKYSFTHRTYPSPPLYCEKLQDTFLQRRLPSHKFFTVYVSLFGFEVRPVQCCPSSVSLICFLSTTSSIARKCTVLVYKGLHVPDYKGPILYPCLCLVILKYGPCNYILSS